MINLLVLILVAIIVGQDVESLKTVKDWVVGQQWKEGKWGVPFALVIGSVAGITLGIGATDAVLKAMTIEYALPQYFVYFDIFSSCMLLMRGAGSFVDVFEQFKDMQGQLKQDK